MADEAPGFVREMLSEENIRSAGVFDPVAVKQLIEKLKVNKQVSEMDHMALTAIISTQLLYDMFVKRTVPELLDEELVVLDKVIIDL
jgi:asparagine synthase (glutamine-hydrolysing)